MYTPRHITQGFLDSHPNHIFIFGDNTLHRGDKGAASLRFHNQSYGFITKKRPSYDPDAYYKPSGYKPVFDKELSKLMQYIENNPKLTFMISQLGAGLANKYKIWESIIRDGLKTLEKYPNVIFLYEEGD